MDYQVDREDVLLLILDSFRRKTGSESLRGITRLEKLIFLLAKEQQLESANSLYGFTAYKFGPFSKDVYEATAFLDGLGLLEVTEAAPVSFYASTEEEALQNEVDDSIGDGDDRVQPDIREKVFRLTEWGQNAAQNLRKIWEKSRSEDLAKIDDAVSRFAALPLNQIIRYVYRQFPKWAENSIHPEAKRIPAID